MPQYSMIPPARYSGPRESQKFNLWLNELDYFHGQIENALDILETNVSTAQTDISDELTTMGSDVEAVSNDAEARS